MLDQDGDTNMLSVKQFTIITGGAQGVELRAETLAREYNLDVKVLIPPCHPRRQTVTPLTKFQLTEAIPWTHQASVRLHKISAHPITLQYIHGDYHVVKEADMVMAFTLFIPNGSVCMGQSGWSLEFAKLLKKTLYVFDLEKNIWFWYKHDEDLFYPCEHMTECQVAVPTLTPKTAIIGVKNIFDFPEGLDEMILVFKRSLLL